MIDLRSNADGHCVELERTRRYRFARCLWAAAGWDVVAIARAGDVVSRKADRVAWTHRLPDIPKLRVRVVRCTRDRQNILNEPVGATRRLRHMLVVLTRATRSKCILDVKRLPRDDREGCSTVVNG